MDLKQLRHRSRSRASQMRGKADECGGGREPAFHQAAALYDGVALLSQLGEQLLGSAVAEAVVEREGRLEGLAALVDDAAEKFESGNGEWPDVRTALSALVQEIQGNDCGTT